MKIMDMLRPKTRDSEWEKGAPFRVLDEAQMGFRKGQETEERWEGRGWPVGKGLRLPGLNFRSITWFHCAWGKLLNLSVSQLSNI